MSESVCPQCDSVAVKCNATDGSVAATDYDAQWWCQNCGAHFDCPDKGERQRAPPAGPANGGLAQRLWDEVDGSEI